MSRAYSPDVLFSLRILHRLQERVQITAGLRSRTAARLAPAYDLTRCNNGYNGEHATSVNNHGNPTIEDMLIVGESIRIPRKKGKEMILTIAEGCAELLSKDYSAAAF